jgi:RNA polymerase sigma-70 factor (ECF subfamily)
MTDEELMTAFQDGDDAAFEQLYARYRRSIYQFVYRRMANGPRAEELTQEVFMGLIRSRGTWRKEASFKTYLYRIAFNQCASEARRADFRATEPLEHPDGTPKDVEADGPAPDAEATRRQEAGLVAKALGELDDDQREAIMLREYQGLAYEEIAEVLGVAVGTVKSRIFRGKLELKRLLAPVLGADAGDAGGGRVIPMRSPSQ